MSKNGSFTLPGEKGYEGLTLEMAKKWGADVIRDSDGTQLSPEILNAGYGIYSTICIIREHNEFLKRNPECLQQTFLMTKPKLGKTDFLVVHLMDGYYPDQFKVNDTPESIKYWQVFDRTTNQEVSKNLWTFEKESGNVIIQTGSSFHSYTVNFFAYRIWEEISMYNHVTNNWKKEHLMPLDPRSKKAQSYMSKWLNNWCKENEETTVVRFTSMFYNFVWIWGESDKNRNLFSDWGSYDFTVSPLALDEYAKTHDEPMTSEDFIHQGKLHVTHMPPNKKQLSYMEFTNRFVLEYGKQLVEMVQSYGKKAYVFYDDSWIGVEPYSNLFRQFSFDGLIKCVFNGFEVRLCAGVDVPIHELRLHPYLFPVGLGGAPTFAPGGNPTEEAKMYWTRVRRALLREKIDRIGLGGYLHLVEDYPDFCDYIEEVANEFRLIKALHEEEQVSGLAIKVAVLHRWGSLRSWSLSGHFHETYMHDLIHVNEALAGLPVQVSFISFEDVLAGDLVNYQVVINAGAANTAWSGGDIWENDQVIRELTQWVEEGGCFIGINQPSAVEGYLDYFRMAPVLGVDQDTGAKVCHGRYQFEEFTVEGLIPKGAKIKGKNNRMVLDEQTKVLIFDEDNVALTFREMGKGMGIYLSEFTFSNENTRLLLNLLIYGTKQKLEQKYLPTNANTECAYFAKTNKLIVINNSSIPQITSILTQKGEIEFTLLPYETKITEG